MLALRIGNRPDYSFRVKPRPALLNERRVGAHIIEGELEHFDRLAIMRGRKGKYQLLIIEPAPAENEIISREPGFADDADAFWVRGGFRIVEQLGGRKALDTFSEFSAV